MSAAGHGQMTILDVDIKPSAFQSGAAPPFPERRRTLSRKRPPAPDPDSFTGANRQPFWKFHINKFGPSMYLSTNPSPKHLHCRNAPGYFISLEGSDMDYTMVFEDIETGEILATVQKRSGKSQASLHYTLHKRRVLRDGALVDEDQPSDSQEHLVAISGNSGPSPRNEKLRQECRDDDGETGNPPRFPKRPDFQGRLVRKPITGDMIPAAALAPQINLQGTMIDGQRWSVGSIPQVRDSRLHSNEVKYVSKLNVYFHCKTDSQAWKGEASSQVKAVLRECETKSRKRLLRHINRLSRVPSAEVPGPEPESPYLDIKYYSKCGDGLFYDKTPADDEPDHQHKLGWLTVYEDGEKYRVPGFFDLVVVLTVAASHEKNCNC